MPPLQTRHSRILVQLNTDSTPNLDLLRSTGCLDYWRSSKAHWHPLDINFIRRGCCAMQLDYGTKETPEERKKLQVPTPFPVKIGSPRKKNPFM
jgi:hypothetical protein